MLSPYITCAQNIGDVQYIGVFSTSGGYHEYIGGISCVHQRMFSTSGDVQYIEGNHEYIGGNHEYIGGIP